MQTGGIEVELIEDRQRIPFSARDWNELSARSETNTIFQTYEWFDAWWSVFGPHNDLFFLVLRKRGEVVGFAPFMLRRLGLINCLSAVKRYPVLSEQEIVQSNPELILLSSEPFPFREKHVNEVRQICPHSTVMLVDGEMFSWYGSRLKFAPTYLNGLPLPRK